GHHGGRLPHFMDGGSMKRTWFTAPALFALGALLAGTLMSASADNGDTTYYACLFAGSLSQVNTNDYPANCGRGVAVSWGGEETPPGIVAEDIYVVSNTVNYPTNYNHPTDRLDADAFCEDGDIVLAGGFEIHAQGDLESPRWF